MWWVLLILVVASSIWVGVDATDKDYDSPMIWAFGVLLLWIVVFPLYLYHRYTHKET